MGQGQSSGGGGVAHEMEGFPAQHQFGGGHMGSRSPSPQAALARRNMQQTAEQRRQIEQRQRQSRSLSLEPKAAHEIRAIEHSKSARYGPRTKRGGSGSGSGRDKDKPLWNPERAAAQLIGLQLQNPHAAQQSLLSLIGKQPQLPSSSTPYRQCRKQSGQFTSIDLDLGAEERRDHNPTGLSTHQISILRKMWERSAEGEIADCTKNIMSHLLRSNAQMYQFFNLLGLSDREILSSATFLRQAANFAIVLDFVLTNVQEEAQKVCLALQCLGAQHARLAWPIEPHHWALFTRCFEDNPPKEVFQNAEGHDLWKIIINFLIIQMRLGYERAMGREGSPGSVLATGGAASPRLGHRKPSSEAVRRAASPRLQKNSMGGGGGGGCPTRANTMASGDDVD